MGIEGPGNKTKATQPESTNKDNDEQRREKNRLRKAKHDRRKREGLRATQCHIEVLPGVWITRLDIHPATLDDDLVGLSPLDADNPDKVNMAVIEFLRREMLRIR